MKVLVLGAGLLGVTSAYFLRQQGHEVTVIDRQARRRPRPASPTAGRSRSATPSPGPTPVRR